ncbi:MAG: sodium:proton antiporter, partial [Candidatus Omnitrophica bacterium]|nr:sodium:proton antiporter [Candidatus Omnitrophota bacterium]
PLLYFSFKVKFEKYNDTVQNTDEKIIGAKKVFFIGVGALFMVPILKTVFDLPPYLGVLLGLGLLWVYTDAIHNKEEQLKVPRILAKVDYSSLLFFLGILLAVAALDSAGVLSNLANMLDSTFKNRNIIISLLGIISSIVDNVPLTASTMGMYDIALYPKDSFIWQLIAYCVGTGGSLLIIGSAAGVVVMGMEKIDFSWYIRKVSLIAFIGYLAGIAFLLYI